MADESKTEDKREDKQEERHDAETHSKLDAIKAHLDSLHKRMDSYESKREGAEEEEEEEEEKKEEKAEKKEEKEARGDAKRKDSKRKDSEKEEREDSEEAEPGEKESDEKALAEARKENGLKKEDSSKRKDSEKEERKDSQPPAWAEKIVGRLAAIEQYVSNAPTEDSGKFAEVWNKAERLAQIYADSNGAPKWFPGESLHAYTCRVLGKYKAHSPTCKDVDLTKVTEPAAFAVLTTQIYNDAEAAGMKPETVPSGELRKVVKNVGGREIVTWIARNDDACWRQFTNVSFKVGKFLRPPRGVAHVSAEQA